MTTSEWRTHRPVSVSLRDAVDEFFGDQKTVFATPYTDNHSANFYGDTTICELDKETVAGLIMVAQDGWSVREDEDDRPRPMTEAEAIEAVLDDLQLDRPEVFTPHEPGEITMTSETKITTEINGNKWHLFGADGFEQNCGVKVRYQPETDTVCELILLAGQMHRYDEFSLVTADRIEHQNGWYLTR